MKKNTTMDTTRCYKNTTMDTIRCYKNATMDTTTLAIKVKSQKRLSLQHFNLINYDLLPKHVLS